MSAGERTLQHAEFVEQRAHAVIQLVREVIDDRDAVSDVAVRFAVLFRRIGLLLLRLCNELRPRAVRRPLDHLVEACDPSGALHKTIRSGLAAPRARIQNDREKILMQTHE